MLFIVEWDGKRVRYFCFHFFDNIVVVAFFLIFVQLVRQIQYRRYLLKGTQQPFLPFLGPTIVDIVVLIVVVLVGVISVVGSLGGPRRPSVARHS